MDTIASTLSATIFQMRDHEDRLISSTAKQLPNRLGKALCRLRAGDIYSQPLTYDRRAHDYGAFEIMIVSSARVLGCAISEAKKDIAMERCD